MFNSTASSSSFTRIHFAVNHQTAAPVEAQASAVLCLPPISGPSFYQEFTAHQLVSHISNLATNWDGYGAAPMHPDTARNAHRALSALLLTVPVPEITPNSNGTVSFEWQSRLGHANLEIGLTRFSFFLQLLAGPTIPVGGAAPAVPDLLGSVISALLFPAAGARLTVMTSIAK